MPFVRDGRWEPLCSDQIILTANSYTAIRPWAIGSGDRHVRREERQPLKTQSLVVGPESSGPQVLGVTGGLIKLLFRYSVEKNLRWLERRAHILVAKEIECWRIRQGDGGVR